MKAKYISVVCTHCGKESCVINRDKVKCKHCKESITVSEAKCYTLRNWNPNIKNSTTKSFKRTVSVNHSSFAPCIHIKYKVEGYWSHESITVYGYFRRDADGSYSVDRDSKISYGSGGYDTNYCHHKRVDNFCKALKDASKMLKKIEEEACKIK